MREPQEIFSRLKETEDESKSFARIKLMMEVMLDIRSVLVDLLKANQRAEKRLDELLAKQED
jgi:hypothetical protein